MASSSSSQGNTSSTPHKLPQIIDNRRFKYIRTETTKTGTRLITQCLLCPTNQEVSAHHSSTGNLLTHLKRKHHEEYERHMKRKADIPTNQSDLNHLIVGVTKGLEKSTNQLITEYIINAMRPLSTVEDKDFKALIKELSCLVIVNLSPPGLIKDDNINIITRYGLDAELKMMYKNLVTNLKTGLQGARYVCLTADAWSTYARSFLGVTAHWINPEDLKRESRVLACTRFIGSQTFNRIADFLVKVIQTYDIPLNKIVSVVTDNGSNFCKAFREFGKAFYDETDQGTEQECREVVLMDEEGDLQIEATEEDDAVQDDQEISGILYHVNIDTVLSDHENETVLPPHFRCISHTLSLVVTEDAKKVKGQRLFYKTMAKCSKLWELSTSPKSADIIRGICGKNFLRPNATRWNSMNKALERLLEMKLNLTTICEKLGVALFSESEIELLEEYALITSPLAQALNLMQGEKGVYMGAAQPTLVQLERKLVALKSTCKFCLPFVDAFLTGLRRRFKDLLDVNQINPSDNVYAAISHPYFKFRWASPDLHNSLKQKFVEKVRNFYKPQQPHAARVQRDVDEFFDFYPDELDTNEQGMSGSTDEVEMECYRYFNDNSTDISMLDNYPNVKNVFLRYNTSLPSSAPVERLFSYGGLILSSRRCNLSDEKFELLVLLKCNNVFSKR